jgi:hypothetical protein
MDGIGLARLNAAQSAPVQGCAIDQRSIFPEKGRASHEQNCAQDGFRSGRSSDGADRCGGRCRQAETDARTAACQGAGRRVAGAPVDCIYMPTVRSTQIYDKIAIVYDAGGTLYVQKPRVGAESLDNDDVLVTRLTSSQLCSIDTVHLVDRTSHFQRGFVGLDKFVPYTKPPSRRRGQLIANRQGWKGVAPASMAGAWPHIP